MALWSEARNEQISRPHPWSRVVQQMLLIPEACVLVALVLLGWPLHFPFLISLLALITMLVFGARLGLMVLAERQLAHGAYEQADRLVRAALRINPYSADALVLRAQGLSQRGEDEAAEHVLRRATTLFPNDRGLQNALASSLLAQGRVAEGYKLAQPPADATVSPQQTQQLAWLALHVEENAVKACALVLQADPEHQHPALALPLLVTLGEAQIVLGQHDNVDATLDQIERRLPQCTAPQQAEILYHLGCMYNALGRSSTTYFRRSVELDPDGRYAQAAWRSAVNATT